MPEADFLKLTQIKRRRQRKKRRLQTTSTRLEPESQYAVPRAHVENQPFHLYLNKKIDKPTLPA